MNAPSSRTRPSSRWLVSLVLALAAQTARAQAAAEVRVTGDGVREMTLSARDLLAMPRVTVRAAMHDQPPSTYEGVSLGAVLERAGLALGTQLRGARLATYVVVDAADGYRVVFAIAELDSAYTTKRVILADHENGAALPAADGPFRIVVSEEQRPTRWVRQVVGVRVLTAPAPAR